MRKASLWHDSPRRLAGERQGPRARGSDKVFACRSSQRLRSGRSSPLRTRYSVRSTWSSALRTAGLVFAGVLCSIAPAAVFAAEPAKQPPVVREIFVPFENLSVVLEGQARRVMLSRKEYDDLLAKAEKAPKTHAPQAALLESAEYTGVVQPERAEMAGTLTVEVLEEGLHAVPLDLSGVGLRSAMLDGKPAPLGQADDGRVMLFVEGLGSHTLELQMVLPLETTAAQQVLRYRLPRPAAARMKLTVPGDVEVKSGADVAARVVDEKAGETRFELVPKPGDIELVMTLNSRLARRQRAVVAQCVLVDEVTEAYERLHATVSMRVLHRAVDGFRFVVPEGFEVTEVSSPLMARWAIVAEGPRRILDVKLREQTTELVRLNLSALRTGPPKDPWTMATLEPLDVVGQVAVVGLLVDERLKAESISTEGLIPIDTAVLRQAIPETVFRAEPGAPTLRAVVAYYAPRASFRLGARFVRPAAETVVRTDVLLRVQEKGLEVRGGFVVAPQVEKLFGFEFTVPPDWQVGSVSTADGKPLAFESYGAAQEPGRVQVRLPSGIAPGQEYRVQFTAVSAPAGWLAGTQARIDFPVFAVVGAKEDTGAIAVDARDDLTVRPEALEGLTPLDEAKQAQYGLGGLATSLAYRYDAQPYKATLAVARTRPRLTARTYSSLRILPDALDAHYEIVYQVEEARTQQVSLLLPADTPVALSVRPLDDVRLKEFGSQPAGRMRRWNVLLEEPRRETIRLAVDFQQPLAAEASKGLRLPIVAADGVAYQSGLVSVEGSPELEVRVATKARRVDVGELVDAEYQPGRHLLGVFGFVGDPAEVRVDVLRHPGYRLHPAIVQRAELTTFVSTNGVSQSSARFELGTKALFLEVRLPPEAELWSADLDGQPVKVQREKKSLLVSVPAAFPGATRALRVVYQAPVRRVGLRGRVAMPAPELWLRAERDTKAVQVPLADLVWNLYLPTGYEMLRADGTVVASLPPSEPAILTAAKTALRLLFAPGPLLLPAGKAAREVARSQKAPEAEVLLEAPSSAPIAAHEGKSVEESAAALPERSVTRDALAVPGMPAMAPQPAPTAEVAPQAGARKGEFEDLQSRSLPVAEDKQREAMGRVAAELQKDSAMIRGEGGAAAGRPARGPAKPAISGAAGYAANGRMLTPAAPALEPGAPPPAAAAPAKKKPGLASQLESFGSLKIDLDQIPGGDGRPIVFQSLGGDPRLEVSVVNRPRLDMLGWGLALAVGLVGVARTGRPVRTKVRFVVAVLVLGTLLPLVPGLDLLVVPANLAVYAACLLVPYYLLAGAAKQIVAFACARKATLKAASPFAAALLAAACLVPFAEGAEPSSKEGPYVIEVVEPSPPVTVPEDAIILPYDPESKTGIQDADQLLVPYTKYVELWNRAYPDKQLQAPLPPAAFALAGATYRTKLAGDEFLVVEGKLEFDVFTEQYVSIPLGLQGGVLARADLDGKPARLSVPAIGRPEDPVADQQAQPPGPQQAAGQAAGRTMPPERRLVLLHVAGKGRHVLELAVRLRLERRGGWRVAEGILPAAPASALAITVPDAKTELRLGHVLDRTNYETERPSQEIQTALGPGGRVSLQWRPKVAEAEVDRSLTVRSAALLDVQEDGLRVAWQLNFEFPRSQRDVFSVQVPREYLVEKVQGGNVRGWETRQAGDGQTIEVGLLKTAKDAESFTVLLRLSAAIATGELGEFDVPVVAVPDAALHQGEVTIRRSLLLDVRATSASGVVRTDLSSSAANLRPGGADSDESPLELRPYQAYRFTSTPFAVRLAAAPLAGKVTADVQTTLRISQFERTLRSQINLAIEDRPVYAVRVLLPEELRLDDVSAPGEYQWALTSQQKRPLLTVYLASGQQGKVAVVLRGTLGRADATEPLAVPRIEVLDVLRQQGDIAVLVDPAFDVHSKGLENCEAVLLHRVSSWLSPDEQRFARLALHYRAPGYRGTLQLGVRTPLVTCDTITNLRVTDRAVEETILLDFRIQQAGIRQLEFLLPSWMTEARISAPLLRQKTVEPSAATPGSPLRVRLELQDEVMEQFRVLVVNDRLLTPQAQTAPIPVVKTGRTDRQFVVLQSAGRDEVVVEQAHGVERLTRQQREWEKLTAILGGSITQAYLVTAEAATPRLVFRTHERTAVETTGARIGLAETKLVLDAHGAYRAEQVYRLDNTTEQFLEVQLPEGAELWTVRVAGQAVKPTQVPGAKQAGRVRIPLVKTAPGDLDYPVVLKYAGQLGNLGALETLSFPLVRTVNINVELSQVRLYLPETHEWFDFGGTMGLVGQEEDLTAGYFSYQTKVAERLSKTMRTGDDFAKVRAANSLRSLKEMLLAPALQSSRGYRSELLDQEYRRNEEVLRQAEQQVQQLEAAQTPEEAIDNRARLRDLYQGQKTSRAKNVVQEAGGSVARPVGREFDEKAGNGLKLNLKWLDQNKLLNEPEGAKRQQIKRLKDGSPLPKPQGDAGGKARAADQPAATPTVPIPSQQPQPQDRHRKGEGAMPESRGRMLDEKRDQVSRYRQEHMQQQQAQQVLEQAEQLEVASDELMLGRPARTAGQAAVGPRGALGPAGVVSEKMGGAAADHDMTVAAEAALAGGLASLDVELPMRGVVYRFSTPQGDIAITARAASRRLTTGLVQTAAIVVLALLILGAVKVARGGAFAWLVGRTSAWVLLAVGLVTLCVLPVPGFIAMLAGLTILARRATGARAAPR